MREIEFLPDDVGGASRKNSEGDVAGHNAVEHFVYRAVTAAREDEFRAGLEHALEYASRLGCPQIHVMAGVRPQEVGFVFFDPDLVDAGHGACLNAIDHFLPAFLAACRAPVVIVSNEVGLSVVPENALARRFRNAQGKLNQRLAAQAGLAVAVWAGLPVVATRTGGNPELGIGKTLTDAPDPVELGSVLEFTVTATNTGDVTLNNVTVSDPMLTPDSVVCASVAPG